MAETYRGISVEQEMYRDRLLAIGVRTVTDPRRIEIPCALVVPERAESQATLGCNGVFDTDWVISIMSGPTSGRDSMQQLSAMAALVLQGMAVGNVTVEWSSRRIDTSGDPVPCIDIRWTTQSDWLGLVEDEETRQPAASNS